MKAKSAHLKSLKHKANNWIPCENGVELCRSAFKKKISCYKINSKHLTLNIKEFAEEIRSRVIEIIENSLHKFKSVKMNFELFALYSQPSKDLQEMKSFNTKYVIITLNRNLENIFENFFDIIDRKMGEFQERDSGVYLFTNPNKIYNLNLHYFFCSTFSYYFYFDSRTPSHHTYNFVIF